MFNLVNGGAENDDDANNLFELLDMIVSLIVLMIWICGTSYFLAANMPFSSSDDQKWKNLSDKQLDQITNSNNYVPYDEANTKFDPSFVE